MRVITRLGYCERCFNEGRPKTGQNFMVFGTTSNRFKGLKSEGGRSKGLVPHIYKSKFTTKNVVHYKRICCMENCGAYCEEENGRKFLYLDETKWINEVTSLSNWNALVEFRDYELVI